MAYENHMLEPRSGENAASDEQMAARSEIERTRARMSETIDEIENVLLRKKARLQQRMDVMAPVRERPIQSAAAALGAGLLLGLITGGDGREDGLSDRERERLQEAEERAATWEARARRLVRAAREREAELALHRDDHVVDLELADDRDLHRAGFRDRFTDGVTGFFGSVARDLFAGR
jgi:ElaB/YqjD/DUF883 family membrane-anchored ribosome-binding protein